MSIQLHKRLPREFIEGILEAFNDQRSWFISSAKPRSSVAGSTSPCWPRKPKKSLAIRSTGKHYVILPSDTVIIMPGRKRKRRFLFSLKLLARASSFSMIHRNIIFSLHYERRVKKDGAFSFRGKEYKLRQCAGALVTLCLILHQKLLVAWNGQRVGNFPL